MTTSPTDGGVAARARDWHHTAQAAVCDVIEPLVKRIGAAIAGIDEKLAGMSGDLAPVGELAEKLPGVKRR